jgi:uncharacterized PurR-regulated membrane protein YhhQ (DUF165 family)
MSLKELMHISAIVMVVAVAFMIALVFLGHYQVIVIDQPEHSVLADQLFGGLAFVVIGSGFTFLISGMFGGDL